jgi:hypothetical protein
MITLKIINNPFQPCEGELKQIAYLPGQSVFDYTRGALMLPENQVGIIHNARVLSHEEFHTIFPMPGDFIAVMPMVAGGGGDNNKNILATIATFILMAYAPYIGVWGSTATGALGATTVSTTWNFWGWAAYMGTVAAGGALINHLFPPPQPEEQESLTYGWNGVRPLAGQNQPVPVLFGTIKMAGQVVSSYVNYSGSQQYLNILIEAGEGPCDYIGNGEDANCVRIWDIRINGSPIENYKNVQVYKRAGLNNQSVIPNFNDTRIEKSLSYQLDNDKSWYTDTLVSAGDGLEVVFYWPGGLRDNGKNGNHRPMIERIFIEYKLETESTWTPWREFEIEAETAQAFWRTFRLNNISNGIYNVRCKCTFMGIKRITTTTEYDGTTVTTITYVREQNDDDFYRVYWTTLTAIVSDDFARPNKILLGIKALATDQLNGSPAITFNVTRSNVWVWNPVNGEYQQKPATNPAWAVYWMLHRVYYLQNINTGEWEYVVRGVPATRLLYHEFERWAEFCQERSLEVNIVFDTIRKLKEALAEVEELGRGKVVSRGTKYGCIFDEPAQKDLDGNIIPAQVFNMSNIVLDSFSEQFVDISDRATAIEVTFFDRDNNYERTPILVPADGIDDATALVNPTQITLKGCTSKEQAWKEGKYRLRLNNYLNCSGAWQADVDAIVSSLGQVIMIQHDVPAWGMGGRIIAATENTITLDKSIVTDGDGHPYYDPEKSYQVLIRLYDDTMVYRNIQSMDETGTILTLATPFETIPAPGDLWNFGELHKVSKPFKLIDIKRSGDVKYQLAGLEYIDEVYTEAEDVPDIDYSYLEPIFEVTGLTVKEETFRQKDGTMVSRLNCSWQCPAGKTADSYRVYYSTDDGVSWNYYVSTIEMHSYIDNVMVSETYYIKIIVVKGVIVSAGTISAPYTITGKNLPPQDVPKLVVRQTDSQLKATVTPSNDPDIAKYELRTGWNWSNSTLIKEFEGEEYIFPAPSEGTLTFWIKAIDTSGNKSFNATKAICTVFGLKPTNVIYRQNLDLSSGTPQNMYLDIWGRWHIQGVAKLTDFEYFSDLFEERPQLQSDSQLVFPEIDLGPNILEEGCFYLDMWGVIHLKSIETAYDFEYFSDIFDMFYSTGFTLVNPKYATQTLLGINITFNTSSNSRIEIDYRTRVDGDGWSEWTPYSSDRQFFGRRIMPRLSPISVDGVTDVIISKVNVIVDVPDVEDVIKNTLIPAAKTRIYYHRKFFDAPKSITPFTTDATGKQATCRIDPAMITRDSFDIEILDDSGNLISGILQRVTVRGF